MVLYICSIECLRENGGEKLKKLGWNQIREDLKYLGKEFRLYSFFKSPKELELGSGRVRDRL